MIGQSNITTMLVASNTAAPAAGIKASELASGQIGVFINGACIDSAISSGAQFQVIEKTSDGLLKTTQHIVAGADDKKAFAPVEGYATQETYIGYDGSAGAIVINEGEDYVLHIFVQDPTTTHSQGGPVLYAAGYAAVGASQYDIAASVVSSLNKNLRRTGYDLLYGTVVVSEAGAAPTTASTATFVKGSAYVSFTDAADFLVGDAIKVPGGDTYAIVSKDGNSVKLDRLYAGESATLDAVADLLIVASAALDGADAGIGVLATDQSGFFDPGVRSGKQIYFTMDFNDAFNGTPVNTTQVASDGSGQYYIVADNEWFLAGNSGETWRVGNYPKNVHLESQEGTTYEQVSYTYKDRSTQTVDRIVESFGTLLLAAPQGSDQSTYLQTVFGV